MIIRQKLPLNTLAVLCNQMNMNGDMIPRFAAEIHHLWHCDALRC